VSDEDTPPMTYGFHTYMYAYWSVLHV
jgi:hypothetical protein